ncbi:hypothetical protein [Lentzea sp. NBRC 102530]|uniref:hypothetical protein n=1 Tax=Lentzea sp. NBRC 102530 TaxID=3032201 RepID=UPI002554ED0F|nr:hypothetical protein [Lentzea sp. NBRC 102530]
MATRVARGVALLDEKKPGWDGHIHLPTLDIMYGTYCVLGQVFGNYDTGARILGLDIRSDVVDCGFNGPFNDEGRWQDMCELKHEWVRVITSRRQNHEVTL